MVKQYKKELILSSLVILLPTVFGLLIWDKLPSLMPTHFGVDGQTDSWSSKAFAVFFLPVTMLAFHWLCLFISSKDPKNTNRNQKVFKMVLWMMPAVSVYASAIMYLIAFGHTPSFSAFICIPLGVMFFFVGNYLPKCQQNHTMGIKIPWTLANEENWNLTHRFGGKCWVIGSIPMLLCAFLPEWMGICAVFCSIFLMVGLPTVYSYRVYKKHKAQGIVYPKVYLFGNKKVTVISTALLILLFAGVAVLMFTGDLTYVLEDDSFTVEASFYTDLTVAYDSIDAIEFREGNIPGTRIGGFGSARLLMGHFSNEEFGAHMRYSYVKPDGCIVIRSGEKVLVLSARRYSETLKLYQQLMAATTHS